MEISEARRLTGLTQAQLDAAAGLTLGTTADLERGKNKNPSYLTVTKIVQAFQERGLTGLTPEDLFGAAETDTTRRRVSA